MRSYRISGLKPKSTTTDSITMSFPYRRFCSRGNSYRCAIVLIFLLFFILILLLYPGSQSSTKKPDSIWPYLPPETEFIWNRSEACSNSKNDSKVVAIIVNSGRENFERRQLIRETWGSVKNYDGWSIIVLNFNIGSEGLDEDPMTPTKLEEEMMTHGDLVMGNFLDTYRNLTLKTIMGYEWLSEFCPQVKICVKSDDDVVLNIFQLTKWLNENPFYGDTSIYYGDVKKRAFANRDATYRWFVSKEDYPRKKFPTYCSGFGYLMTMTIVQKVLAHLPKMKSRISIDDIYLTGIVPTSFNVYVNRKVYKDQSPIQRLNTLGNWHFSSNGDKNVEKLRDWYDSTGDSKKDTMFRRFFYIIKHTDMFQQDFTKTWIKITRVVGYKWQMPEQQLES